MKEINQGCTEAETAKLVVFLLTEEAVCQFHTGSAEGLINGGLFSKSLPQVGISPVAIMSAGLLEAFRELG